MDNKTRFKREHHINDLSIHYTITYVKIISLNIDNELIKKTK